jgi:hypothetical protein
MQPDSSVSKAAERYSKGSQFESGCMFFSSCKKWKLINFFFGKWSKKIPYLLRENLQVMLSNITEVHAHILSAFFCLT